MSFAKIKNTYIENLKIGHGRKNVNDRFYVAACLTSDVEHHVFDPRVRDQFAPRCLLRRCSPSCQDKCSAICTPRKRPQVVRDKKGWGGAKGEGLVGKKMQMWMHGVVCKICVHLGITSSCLRISATLFNTTTPPHQTFSSG